MNHRTGNGVLDKDRNDVIDDKTELFGDRQGAINGFEELARDADLRIHVGAPARVPSPISQAKGFIHSARRTSISSRRRQEYHAQREA